MTDATWVNQDDLLVEESPNRLKFVIGGLLIVAALIYLVSSAFEETSQLFISVDQYYENPAKYAGVDLRIAGWVVGDTIQFTQVDAANSRLEFDVVDDLDNPGHRMRIVANNEPMPDTLQHEAQALVEGRVENGQFIANKDGLLLKCPTRYEELEPPTN